MKFKVGDHVSYLDEEGRGKIISIINERYALVETEDGFDVKYLISNLVLLPDEKSFRLDGIEHVLSVQEKVQSEGKMKIHEDFDRKSRSLVSYVKEEVEIDLHIEELIDSHRGMSNAEILSVQMANFKRELNVAIRRKAKRMIVIHGVGEGRLKSEIIRELSEHYPNFEFHDASYRKYGYGATEIIFH